MKGARLMGGEDFDLKFQAAWDVFARTRGVSVAPEATYQAWFSHYLVSQFGIDRVAREPIFRHKNMTSRYRQKLPGGEVKIDAVVTRRPGIDMPHYVHRDSPDGSGIELLADLAVITELKISATQGEGLDHTEVCKDFWKLSMLLEEADRRGVAIPFAYVCILDNHRAKQYNFDCLVKTRLRDDPPDPRVKMLAFRSGIGDIDHGRSVVASSVSTTKPWSSPREGT